MIQITLGKKKLSLVPVHRRGHGAAYDAINAGRVDIARLRRSLACHCLPGMMGGSGWRATAGRCRRAGVPASCGMRHRSARSTRWRCAGR